MPFYLLEIYEKMPVSALIFVNLYPRLLYMNWTLVPAEGERLTF